MLKKFFFALQTHVLSKFYVNTNADYHQSILLSSLGRSGSTLVSDIINYNNDYRIIFEPFKHNAVKIAQSFVYPCYMSPFDETTESLNTLNTILTGKIRSSWTDKDNKKMIATKRLIKDIRTNLMLNWIKIHYPDLPIVILIRNPFATIESWMRAKWSADVPKRRLLQQEILLKPFLPGGVLEAFRSAENQIEMHIFNWCINYYIPLQRVRENKYYVTFYENYLVNPEREIEGLFNYIKKPFHVKALKSLQSFSRTTRNDSPLRKGENPLLSWRTKFTASEISEGIRILAMFNFDTLYDFENSGLPLNNS